ncbi:3'(2'),5'-bisphosphate nucleotidase CysQ [Chiayiivirga flava]|uniref:3'(2'),5'-bisphosphate nucleotidase CysQ n=1 Tax=Chiayiivirga flava TaxID=659595 RepID=A0A7W8G125_9GAMM|nr:3'(2'),5'-bisphosphate nucleotidase CysQ [Chiayiivirga flava]MBB5207230.1 3'(2'), 5'-bisphosphate nucleotidase [Chiayiivirga flava]
MSDLAAWRARCVELSHEAGAAIMRVYAQDFSVQTKSDNSPVTAADFAAHHIISTGLGLLTPQIPVLSEEAADIPWSVRRHWTRWWLVDPLDGTREFIKKNGEFTVNIALIDRGVPVLGVVHAPALDYLVSAERGVGAWMRSGGEEVPIATARPSPVPLRVAASRSHLDERTRRVLERIGDHERLGLGSSLKFCRIAEGRADVYPRFGPTSEWDTAAGQCVLDAAGGCVLGLDGAPFRYNRGESLLNPDFIALGDPDLPWQDWTVDLAAAR